jgi:hypothetical protein
VICATTDFFMMDSTDADDHFPNDDFFPEVNNLFDDMADDDVNANANATVATQYVFMFFLFEFLPQLLVLASVLDMFCSYSLLQMLFAYSLSECMTYLISPMIVMFCCSNNPKTLLYAISPE